MLSIAWSPDGKKLASGCKNSQVGAGSVVPWCPSSWAGGESGGVQSGLAQETLCSSGLKQNTTCKVGARGFRGEDLFSLAAWARQVSSHSEQDFLCPGGALRADAS